MFIKKRTIIIMTALSVLIFIISTIFSILFFIRYKTYTNALENLYQKTYYELAGNIDDIELDISKLVATTSESSQAELLNNIYISCVLANDNISSLPLSNRSVNNINNFINTLGGYCYSLISKLNNNSELNTEDMENVFALHSQSAILLYDLNKQIASLDFDYSIVKDIDYKNEEKSDFETGLINTESSYSKVPTLIYDGPFSDSVLNQEIKGLGTEEITIEEGVEKIASLFEYYKGYTIEYIGDTSGKFSTYNYELVLEEKILYIQVTKLGGFLLNISSYGQEEGEHNLSSEQCVDLAEEVALEFGFENMKSVWELDAGNIYYINLAPIVDSVIYYPDLIKIKIDKRLGLVIGWEAKSYAYNHIERESFSSSFGILEGEELLSSALIVKERNKVVVPNKYVGENFAYEYICSWKDYTYYIYINSHTGEEINIMRVVDTSSGKLLF